MVSSPILPKPGSGAPWAAAAFLLLAVAAPPAASQAPPPTAAPPSPPAGETTPAAPPPGTPAPVAPPSGDAARPSVAWTLDDAVRIALDRHPLVKQADAETRAAGARKGQAASAYYPTIELAAGYSKSRGFFPSLARSVEAESLSAQGNLSWTLADFGRRGASVDRAGALLAASRESGRAARQDVALDARTAFFDVLRASLLLSVQRDTVAQREGLLRQARAFYDAGIRARIDVARAEANLYEARAGLAAAENELRVARITLLNRMGVDGPPDYALSYVEEAEALPGTLEEWAREAEGARPELLALLSRERAAAEAVRAARAGHYPLLTGSGGAGYASDDFPLEPKYNVAVELSVPVFTGFLVREQVAEARADLAAARAAVTDGRRLVHLEVERASLAVGEAAERIEARRKESEASDENLRLAAARYQVGAGDIIEMIDAQVQKARSDTGLIQALYDRRIATARLLRAIGRDPAAGRESRNP